MKENNPLASQQEKYFLNTFPLINNLILKKSNFIPPRFVNDLIQQVKFKLWRWKQNHLQDKELTLEEWKKIVNVATKNEIRDYYRRKENQNVLFSELINGEQIIEQRSFQQPSVEENTRYESITLLLRIWQKYQYLSLRQKYAFLFHKYEFVTYLLKYGCCSPKDIADSLILGENEFVILLGQLPLTDTEILNLLVNKFGEELTVKQIWTARSKDKANLQKNLKGYK